MNNSKDTELQRIARLRLARIIDRSGQADEAIKTLAQESWGAFAPRAHEVRGDAFYAKKDSKSAVTEYKAALDGGDANNVTGRITRTENCGLGRAADPRDRDASDAHPTPN